MNKVITIISAYYKLLLAKTLGLPKEIVEEANRRNEICDKCDFLTKNIFGDWCDSNKCLKSYTVEKDDFGIWKKIEKKVCGCGCLINAKKYVENNTECPLKKW